MIRVFGKIFGKRFQNLRILVFFRVKFAFESLMIRNSAVATM